MPLLGWVDLAVHEFGHLATSFLPQVANAVMGNGAQTLLPVALAGVFGLRERNWLGVVVCLGWAATTLQDASVYVADAPYQRLPLIGGYHDWAFALTELGRLHQSEAISRLLWTAGLLLWLAAAAGCVLGPWVEPAIGRAARSDRSAEAFAGEGEVAQPRRVSGPGAPAPAADWRDYFA